MGWLYILIASIIEVIWVIGLRYSDNLWEWMITVIMIAFSIFFVIKACETIPSGTVYSIFTGLGATALVIIDLYVFNHYFSKVQLLCIALVIIGVVGLKLTSDKRATS